MMKKEEKAYVVTNLPVKMFRVIDGEVYEVEESLQRVVKKQLEGKK